MGPDRHSSGIACNLRIVVSRDKFGTLVNDHSGPRPRYVSLGAPGRTTLDPVLYHWTPLGRTWRCCVLLFCTISGHRSIALLVRRSRWSCKYEGHLPHNSPFCGGLD